MSWFKWWKDKTFMSVLGIALASMVASFLLAYFLDWGWIISIVVVCLGGVSIRRLLSKKIGEILDDFDSNNNFI